MGETKCLHELIQRPQALQGGGRLRPKERPSAGARMAQQDLFEISEELPNMVR